MRTENQLGLWALASFVVSLSVTHIYIRNGPYGAPFFLISEVLLVVAAKKAENNSNPAALAYVLAVVGEFSSLAAFLWSWSTSIELPPAIQRPSRRVVVNIVEW